MTSTNVKTLFNRLDQWRNIPNYALERRSDIFFSFFLVKVLSVEYGMTRNSVVIPEFPLKKENNHQSKKVDFLVVTRDGKSSCLIELKTDNPYNIPDEQLDYLDQARSKKLSTLIEDIKKVTLRADRPQRFKYLHLLNILSETECVNIDPRLRLNSFDPPFRIRELIRDGVQVKHINSSRPKIVCIVPTEPKLTDKKKYPYFKWIDFKKFADRIEMDGKLANRFAESLRSWADRDAGYISNRETV